MTSAWGAAGCVPPESSSHGSGGGGAGGTGASSGSGGCLMTPQPTFALRVLVGGGGVLPPDTTVEVTWSAGMEVPFHLDDPSTWGSLETSNLVCDVDPKGPAPQDMMVLTCDLWTAGPTDVRVSAKGFMTKEHTYTPDPPVACEPKPTPIEIKLFAEHN